MVLVPGPGAQSLAHCMKNIEIRDELGRDGSVWAHIRSEWSVPPPGTFLNPSRTPGTPPKIKKIRNFPENPENPDFPYIPYIPRSRVRAYFFF